MNKIQQLKRLGNLEEDSEEMVQDGSQRDKNDRKYESVVMKWETTYLKCIPKYKALGQLLA